MAKRRLEIKPNTHVGNAPAALTLAAPAQKVVEPVGDPKPGLVTTADKAKAYWHTIIVTIGLLLAFATNVAPFVPEDWKGGVTIAVGVLTALSTALKSNEFWVDDGNDDVNDADPVT